MSVFSGMKVGLLAGDLPTSVFGRLVNHRRVSPLSAGTLRAPSASLQRPRDCYRLEETRVATGKKQACFFRKKTFFFAKKTQPEKNRPKFCFFHF